MKEKYEVLFCFNFTILSPFPYFCLLPSSPLFTFFLLSFLPFFLPSFLFSFLFLLFVSFLDIDHSGKHSIVKKYML